MRPRCGAQTRALIDTDRLEFEEMPVHEIAIAGYRSIRDLRMALKRVNVLTGHNGCGKSNLYNAVFLLTKAATGGLARSIADEGGMPSVLYAGPEGRRLTRKAPPRRVILSVRTDLFEYELQLGLPQSAPPHDSSMFLFDAHVKEESIRFIGDTSRPLLMLDRKGPSASVRDESGRIVSYPFTLDETDATLAQIYEPHRYPELSQLRESIRRWRFYHAFRTDPESPLRRRRAGVITPVLHHDGSDLAAALQTIREIGDAEALDETIAGAFAGARLEIAAGFSILMHMPGVLRPVQATELSDGTLRFLCVAAALLSPRPPELLALNEPESSLHPDLLPPLAALIGRASRDTQIWITTHSPVLAKAVEVRTGEPAVQLALRDGATVIETV
jgi:predicted ATPase